MFWGRIGVIFALIVKMNLRCPRILPDGTNCLSIALRHGSYCRSSDSKEIERFRCPNCHKTFSRATFQMTYRQKTRRFNPIVGKLLSSCVSQRRIALILGINRKTVAAKQRFLALLARQKQDKFLGQLQQKPIHELQFDDLETFEHTKCKPVSICLAVEKKSRKILHYSVSRMPAKGLLAEISRHKYGTRLDERQWGWIEMFEVLQQITTETVSITSDENPRYISYVKRYFPRATYKQVKGQRGAITGQGELKKVVFDPLFSLNHTCAMLRANINRLVRKTWCTTKSLAALRDHLDIYVSFHNQVLT